LSDRGLILIVDDDASSAAALHALLESDGYGVVRMTSDARRWALHRGRFYLDSVVRAGRIGLPSLSPVALGKVSLSWSDP
jgi:DNA-binding NtrC family response regulator